jgi:hypothetical protein
VKKYLRPSIQDTAKTYRQRAVTSRDSGAPSLTALIALTEHRSGAQAIWYFQSGSATTNPAARLLEGAS